MPLEGLIGRKLGMAQVFDNTGTVHAVTVVEVGPITVTQVKSETKDGYAAIQVGYGARKRSTKAMRGHLKGIEDKKYNPRMLREFKVRGDGEYSVGDQIGIELFEEGDLVDVQASSKGRGFAGGVKRWGFHGGPKTHGQSDRHRAPGSIGSGTTPGRVYKGQKMAGHMGAVTARVKNLRIVAKDEGKSLLLIAGSVPGASNGIVRVTHAKKHSKK